MRYLTRLGHYLDARPNQSSAPELTHLTGKQRRRLSHKLGHAKQRVLKRKGINPSC